MVWLLRKRVSSLTARTQLKASNQPRNPRWGRDLPCRRHERGRRCELREGWGGKGRESFGTTEGRRRCCAPRCELLHTQLTKRSIWHPCGLPVRHGREFHPKQGGRCTRSRLQGGPRLSLGQSPSRSSRQKFDKGQTPKQNLLPLRPEKTTKEPACTITIRT